MGRDKATVELAGKPMIEWVSEALDMAGCEVVVAGRPSSDTHHTAVADLPEDRKGPIAGLHAVAAMYPGRSIILVAVDQPLVRARTIAELLALEGPVVAPVDQGITQVTCAVYRCFDLPDGLLASAPSLQAVIRSVAPSLIAADEWSQWDEDGRSWFSVDDPASLERATRLAAR